MNQRFDPPLFMNPHQEAVFWRGALVHHYAMIEFGISDLIVRIFFVADYQDLSPTMHYPWGKRLRQFGRILDAPGPLSVYSARCRNLISQISIIETDRHLIVHGQMRVDEAAPEPIVHFECYDAANSCISENYYRLSELRYIAQELGAAAEMLLALYDEMIAATGLSCIPLSAPESRERQRREF